MKVSAENIVARKASPGRRLSKLACGVGLSGLLCAGAWAQSSGLMPNAPAGTGDIATGRRNASQAAKPAIPAPDAIPGSRARQPAAPATRALTDMAPNDALFDAINRGDIAAARESLNRGADLNAVNILGMTPMELSVDLGRNDISFLLLSMRGEDSGRGSNLVRREAAAPAASATRIAATRTATPTRSSVVARKAALSKPTPVAMKPVPRPKLFANDGGAPLPGAGFLGFDARSATN